MMEPWPWEALTGNMTVSTDIGLAALDELQRELMMDPEWCVRDGTTLTWWPWQLRQVFALGKAGLVYGDPMVPVHYKTLIVESVADPVKAQIAVGDLNRFAAMNAYVYDGQAHVIALCGSAYLNGGNRKWGRVLRFAALLQNIEAHSKAPQLADWVGGKPAVSPHPTGGFREDMDELLNFVDAQVVVDGQHPSPFVGAPIAGLSGLPRPPWLLVSASDTGATGELPFSGSVSAVEQAMLDDPDAQQSRTSLFQVLGDMEHPYLGSGALVILRLGVNLEAERVKLLAGYFNQAEASEQTGFPLIGAWTQDTQVPTTLAHVTFLPATVFRAVELEVVAFDSFLRNEWARQRLRTVGGGEGPPS